MSKKKRTPKQEANIAQAFEEALDVGAPKLTPYDVWLEWYRLCCDWHIDAQSHDAWNGAVDTVCEYMVNQLCGTGLSLEDIYELRDKIKAKFKNA